MRFAFISIFLSLPLHSHAGEVKVESRTDVTLQALNSSQIIELKANESKSVPFDNALLVKGVGKMPLLLVPASTQSSQVTIDLPGADEVMVEAISEKLSQNLSHLMLGIAEIETSVRRRDLKDAKLRYQQLSERYPNVTFLDFTRASISLLEGNRIEALKIAERALEKHPDYRDGKLFVERLKGNKP